MCIDKDDNTNEDEENIGSSVSPIVIPRIPSELWDEIILLCSQPTQAVLCRLSRQISICVIRRLYRDIVLQSASQVVRCCLTLAINSTAALLVRKLRFQYHSIPNFPLSPFIDIIVAALKSVVLINTLELHLDDEALARANDCLFPHLRTFSCNQSSGPAVVSFLQRHRMLEKVHLNTLAFIQPTFPPIYLPRLTSLIGSYQIVRSLVPGSSIADLLVGWEFDPEDGHFAQSLKAVAASASSLTWLGSITSFWTPCLVHTVTHMFPCIRGLKLEVTVIYPTDRWEETMISALPRFTNLEQLVLTQVFGGDQHAAADKFDVDMRIISEWGALCPSLRTCNFFSGTEWIRCNSVWFPVTVDVPALAWWEGGALSGKFDNHLAAIWNVLVPPLPWTALHRQLLVDIQIRLATSRLAARSEIQSYPFI